MTDARTLFAVKDEKHVGSGNRQNLRGLCFGWLFVFKRITNNNRTYYVCKCSCGTVRRFRADSLTNGAAKSCGCWNKEQWQKRVRTMNVTHGLSTSKIYRIWNSMKHRCLNPNANAYDDYGGRGITVCKRWCVFENFQADMADSYFSGASLERKSVNGNYEPKNCKWVTMAEQQRNKRNNVWITTQDGKCRLLLEVCAEYGFNHAVVRKRLWRGWSEREALHGRG